MINARLDASLNASRGASSNALQDASDKISQTNHIATRLHQLHQEVAGLTADRADPIKIIAVSKTHPASMIEAAYEAGQRDFGENYIQEAVAKVHQLKDLDITWHFIGHLQSNKAKLAAENFSWVHSLDSLKLAKRLNNFRENMPPLNVTLQVNISEEENKSGVSVAAVPDLCMEIWQLPNLHLRGLMAITELTDSSDKQRQQFSKMRKLFDEIKSGLENLPSLARDGKNNQASWDTLSMGMSADMKSAIEEGSNMLRIGTAIFGARSVK